MPDNQSSPFAILARTTTYERAASTRRSFSRHLVDVLRFGNQGRCMMPVSPVHLISSPSSIQAFQTSVAAGSRGAFRREVEGGEQAVAAYVRHDRQIGQFEHPVEKVRGELGRPLEEILAIVDVEGCQRGGRRRRMRREGIAVE